jgi:hypothetical protein
MYEYIPLLVVEIHGHHDRELEYFVIRMHRIRK